MDELENLSAFVDTEIELIKALEQISRIEVQHLEYLDACADNALNISA